MDHCVKLSVSLTKARQIWHACKIISFQATSYITLTNMKLKAKTCSACASLCSGLGHVGASLAASLASASACMTLRQELTYAVASTYLSLHCVPHNV